jgi:hypothetical protein
LQAKEMTEWQQNLKTILERDIYLLDNEMFMDCEFLVGEGEESKVCKLSIWLVAIVIIAIEFILITPHT